MKKKYLNYVFIGGLLLSVGFVSCTKGSSSTQNGNGNGNNTIGNISTVAGGDSTTDKGDGGAATAAGLAEVYSICIDATGNLYISEGLHHRVRKVSTNGIISTYAGTGTSGFSGDGGPATSALLDNPEYMCTDASGKLYISDSWNNRIRTVSTNGIINTVAGSSNIIATKFGDGGQATSAILSWNKGICFDTSNNFYIADYNHNLIRKVSPNGIISSIAGGGSGNSYFSGDGGLATAAKMWGPEGICRDASGNLYVCDYMNKRVRKVSAKGIITTIVGNGSSSFSGDGGQATLAGIDPMAICIDASGNLYIADWGNNRVRKVDTNGIITTVAGGGSSNNIGDGYPATSATVLFPSDVCTDASGNLYIASDHRVRKVTFK